MGLGFKGLREKLNFGIRLCGERHLAQAEPEGGRLSRVPELWDTHLLTDVPKVWPTLQRTWESD